MYGFLVIKLTVCCSLTMPWSLTTFGCLNWPMMAPSCRNLTLSSSLADDLRVFMATSSGELGLCHTPLLTVPNWPEPRHSVALCGTWERRMGARHINDVIVFAQLDASCENWYIPCVCADVECFFVIVHTCSMIVN